MKKTFVVLCLLVLNSFLFADAVFVLYGQKTISINNEAYTFADSEVPRTIESLLREIREKGLENMPRTRFSGEHLRTNAWAYFTLKNESDAAKWILEYDYERTGKEFTLYEIVDGKVVNTIKDGYEIPWSDKDLAYRNPAFLLTLGPGETRDYCLLFTKPTRRPFLTDLQMKLRISPLRVFISRSSTEHLFYGVLLGIIGVMALYNLFLFFSLKQKGYLYYSMFIFFLGILQLNTYGIVARWFPESWNIDYLVSTFFPSFQGLAYVFFSNSLLRLRDRFSKISPVLTWSALAMPLLSLIFFIWNVVFITEIRNAMLMLYVLTVIVLSVLIALRGDRPAKIYIASNLFLLLPAIIGLLMQMGLLPFLHELYYTMDIGIIIMIILSSLALGDEINLIQREKEQAKHESSAKTRFLTNMSHEMRTPLNGIIGFTELIQGSNDLAEIHRQNTLIRKEGGRLLFLINQLLDLAQAEAGRLTLNECAFSISGLINSIESSFLQRAHKKKLELHTNIDADRVHDWYEGDPDRIEQILVNLVGNALKFAGEGTIRIEVSCHAGQVRFSVADTGIGIKETDRNRIFGAFVQADPSITRRFGGSGLGTTIAKELVKIMGGEIGYYSNKPSGTVFWFSLPLKPTAKPDFSGEPHELDQDKLDTLSGTPVLLAEDYPTNQFIALRHLESVNCRVDLAENGRIAVEMAAAKKYALILMDVQMPEMDGLEATRIIRKQGLNTDTPVLAMTASAYDFERRECLENGMNDVIAKPIRKASFLRVVSSWIGRLPTGVDPA
ncbi:MAG: response regulator [Spirochaetales bacterium]|nr:response regulator [Spirochaetales bacterium]